MREKLDTLLQKLGVSYVLSPYETMPWSHYDEEQGLTCSAEVRMSPAGDDIESEIQFFQDETEDDEETGSAGGREQILWMRCEPSGQDEWAVKQLRVKGKDYVNEFGGWEEKGCELFRSCIEALQMGEIPDIEELVENTMRDDSFGGGGRRGKVGRKSPKIKPAQLMGMKK